MLSTASNNLQTKHLITRSKKYNIEIPNHFKIFKTIKMFTANNFQQLHIKYDLKYQCLTKIMTYFEMICIMKMNTPRRFLLCFCWRLSFEVLKFWSEMLSQRFEEASFLKGWVLQISNTHQLGQTLRSRNIFQIWMHSFF